MRIKIRRKKGSSLNQRGAAATLQSVLVLFYVILAPFVLENWIKAGFEYFGLGFLKDFGSILILIFLGIFLYRPAFRLNQRHKIEHQVLRDKEFDPATAQPNALFLRPFFTDSLVLFDNPFNSNWLFSVFLLRIEFPLIKSEEFVARVLEAYINVYEIGGMAGEIGMPRSYTNGKDWKICVAEAIGRSSAIVTLSSELQNANAERVFGDGMMWELQYLVSSGGIDRTIMIMPKTRWLQGKILRESWENARVSAAQFGLILPIYRDRGAVVVFEKKDGSWLPAKIFGEKGISSKRLAKGLIEALQWQAERHDFTLLTS